ncbi:MAG TPA: hypothetical protein VIK72_07940 [Clostridiaceae bacterium]
MNQLINKAVTLIAIVILVLVMKVKVYADILPVPTKATDKGSINLFWIIGIILLVCIVAIVILVRIRRKK